MTEIPDQYLKYSLCYKSDGKIINMNNCSEAENRDVPNKKIYRKISN